MNAERPRSGAEIDLLYFPAHGSNPMQWPHGTIRVLPDRPQECAPAIDAWLDVTKAGYVMFWHQDVPLPGRATLDEITKMPGDVWHAGLRLAMAGLPKANDFVRPTWMFSRDPDASIVATSWRLSLHACVMRTDVLRQLGNMDPHFQTIAAAGLDMGLRYLSNGAIVRNVPQLLSGPADVGAPRLTTFDELRFVRRQYGRKWLHWAAMRAIASGWPPLEVMRAVAKLDRVNVRAVAAPYLAPTVEMRSFDRSRWHNRVSILIPTLERYDYLRNELGQLKEQTVQPRDVVVVDQTAENLRDTQLTGDFSQLPLTYIIQSTTGQCTAWNAALQAARGDYVLFLGDDADRLGVDFIERFCRRVEMSRADMVASVVEEVGAEPPPASCRFVRVSDIFPIAMISRDTLRTSGLMDFAYDHAKRADGDLGMRCYLAGALMMLDPSIRPLHHRASRGGLRKHGVRVITRSTSRSSIRQRHLPSASEMYLALRYFGVRQLREELWIRTVSSWSGSGHAARRLLKLAYGLLALPDTLWQTRREYRKARKMLDVYPQIPRFSDSATIDALTNGTPAGAEDLV